MPKFDIEARFPTFVAEDGSEASHVLRLQVDAYNELAAARRVFKMDPLPVEGGFLNPAQAVFVKAAKVIAPVVKAGDEDDDIPAMHV